MSARGIHAHPTKKLGRRPAKKAPALHLAAFLTGVVPAHPPTADHFAKLDFGLYDDDLDAAVSIFGGVLWGVNLLEAQQAQTDAEPPKWDYRKSGEWGGHAVLHGTYEGPALDDVISWAIRVQTTAAFRLNQLEEAW